MTRRADRCPDRPSAVRFIVLLGLVALAALGPPWATVARAETAASPPSIRFEEVGEMAGARFVHATRDFGERPKAEVLEMFTDGGAAVAVGDVDDDGDDDLFLVDSGEGRSHHLLLNDGPADDGIPRFRDVTERAGVGGGNDARSICADALFFDYDDDGRLDLLVSRFGTPLLWRNQGPAADGIPRFRDVSAQVGLTAFANTIATVVFDADADGYLDILFGHYFQARNLLHLDSPRVLPNNLDHADNGGGVGFWMNVAEPDAPGGRAFVERTDTAGFAHHTGWTLDVGHADLDGDGDQDVYLAGDYGTDRLFLNQGVGEGGVAFRDVTAESLGWDTKKGMNVDIGDYDRDGWLDIYVTNITDEYMRECNMLWHNEGALTEPGEPVGFLDLSRETGTCDTDWGWAAKFADFDNDGWEDLLATNGLRSAGDENYIPVLLEVIIDPATDFADIHSYPDIGTMTWSGYQTNRLFRNLGDGTFREMASDAGIANDLDGRGLALGDFDLDGRLDVVQTSARQPSHLYMNRSHDTGHWLAITLRGTASNRHGIGARVMVRAGDQSWIREVNGGNAYASASTTRVHVGLGTVDRVDEIEVRWPSGRIDRRVPEEGAKGLPVDRFLVIEEGE